MLSVVFRLSQSGLYLYRVIIPSAGWKGGKFILLQNSKSPSCFEQDYISTAEALWLWSSGMMILHSFSIKGF
jgi:hypothetical protein